MVYELNPQFRIQYSSLHKKRNIVSIKLVLFGTKTRKDSGWWLGATQYITISLWKRNLQRSRNRKQALTHHIFYTITLVTISKLSKQHILSYILRSLLRPNCTKLQCSNLPKENNLSVKVCINFGSPFLLIENQILTRPKKGGYIFC